MTTDLLITVVVRWRRRAWAISIPRLRGWGRTLAIIERVALRPVQEINDFQLKKMTI